MAGWYASRCLYAPDELGGLSVTQFCNALSAEGYECTPGCNLTLHTHPLFITSDVYHHGKPTRIANAARDVREMDVGLPVSERIGALTFSAPWFKHYRPEIIEQYANSIKKAAADYGELHKSDPGNPPQIGNWYLTHRKT